MQEFRFRLPLLLLLLALLVCSCVGRQKYTRILEEELATLSTSVAEPTATWPDVILSDTLPSELRVEVLRARFVPALLYWDWNSTLDCALPSDLLAGWFSEGAATAADSLGVVKDRVSVRMEQLPGRFVFTDRGSILILVVAYSTSELEGIIPGEVPVGFTYTVAGTGERALFATGLEPLANPGRSTRRFTRDYLVSLRRSIRESGALWVEDRWGQK